MDKNSRIDTVVKSGLFFITMFSSLLFMQNMLDNDVWFLLNSGRYVLEHGIPHVEPFTIHEGMHFVLSPWLTCVIFWKIYSLFGSSGLLIFAGAVGAIIIGIYYRLCLLVSGGNRQLSWWLTLFIGFFICSFGFVTTRPQIFSTLFPLAEIFLLEKFVCTKSNRYLYPLPFMSTVLINLHASLWPMMLIVLLPYIAASFRFKNFDNYFLSGEIPRRPLIFSALGMLASALLNPYGIEAMIYVFRSLDWNALNAISELQSPTVHHVNGKIFFICLFVMLIAYARKPAPLQYVLLTAGLAFMGLQAWRNLFLFFVLGTFPTAYLFRELNLSDLSIHEDTPHTKRKRLILSLIMLALLAAVISLYCVFVISENTQLSLIQRAYLTLILVFVMCVVLEKDNGESIFEISALPKKSLTLFLFAIIFFSAGVNNSFREKNSTNEFFKPAVDALLKNESAENIVLWTGFNGGGYPEFRGIRCYMDPRAEIFKPVNSLLEKDILQEYFDLRNGDLYYTDFFERYNFTHVLVTEFDMVVFQALSHDENYRLIHEHEGKYFENNIKCRVFECVGKKTSE